VKYILLLGDGMADTPVPELNNRTPLAAASTPNADKLAASAQLGMVRTIPAGMPTGSDTANMSCMGYDPAIYHTGRSPLEAVSMGVELKDDDIALRCNLVTIEAPGALIDGTMRDYSAGEISTAEARILIADLARAFAPLGVQLYPGVSYRHCLVIPHAKPGSTLTPPHDITNQPLKGHLPGGEHGELLMKLTEISRGILADHPVNRDRIAQGKNPANSCWFWGEGTKPAFTTLHDRFGINGGVVCAVDLIRGIGMLAGLRTIDVEGATGGVVTNFRGKADAAIELLRDGCDFVYIHVEAPDECGHQYKIEGKVSAIEAIDRDMVGPIVEAMQADGEDFRLLFMPDHPTPLAKRTHTGDPVPFMLYDSRKPLAAGAAHYDEASAAATGLFIPHGYDMMELLLER